MPGLAALRGVDEDVEATLLLEFVLGGSEVCVLEYVGWRGIDGDDGVIGSVWYEGCSLLSGTIVEATEDAGLGGSTRARFGICDGRRGVCEVDISVRSCDDVRDKDDSGRLNGDDLCALKDKGEGLVGDVLNDCDRHQCVSLLRSCCDLPL